MAGGRNKRKKRTSSSGSTSETLSPTDKKHKEEFSKEITEGDEVLLALNMVEHVAPKLDLILDRLSGLEGKLETLEKKIEDQTKVATELKNELSSFKEEIKDVKDNF
ncbi:hypothetical protein AC249_AIPGENE18176 [Exaiptasia diaphana]|nr:hypothetical protein AC249_AIPGENE18176 [Exaiptasia diaphana]